MAAASVESTSHGVTSGISGWKRAPTHPRGLGPTRPMAHGYATSTATGTRSAVHHAFYKQRNGHPGMAGDLRSSSQPTGLDASLATALSATDSSATTVLVRSSGSATESTPGSLHCREMSDPLRLTIRRTLAMAGYSHVSHRCEEQSARAPPERRRVLARGGHPLRCHPSSKFRGKPHEADKALSWGSRPA